MDGFTEFRLVGCGLRPRPIGSPAPILRHASTHLTPGSSVSTIQCQVKSNHRRTPLMPKGEKELSQCQSRSLSRPSGDDLCVGYLQFHVKTICEVGYWGTNPKNPARVVLIVGNATVAHTSVHDRVHARVCNGHIAAAWCFSSGDKGADSGISAVLLLKLGISFPSKEEIRGHSNRNNNEHSYNDSNCNANGAWSRSLLRRFGYGRCC